MNATKSQMSDIIKQQFKYDFYSCGGQWYKFGKTGAEQTPYTYYYQSANESKNQTETIDILTDQSQKNEFYNKYNRAFSTAMRLTIMVPPMDANSIFMLVVDFAIPSLQLYFYNLPLLLGQTNIVADEYQKIKIPQNLNLNNQNISATIRVRLATSAVTGANLVADTQIFRQIYINLQFYFSIY